MTADEYVKLVPFERKRGQCTNMALQQPDRLFAIPGVMEAVMKEFGPYVDDYYRQKALTIGGCEK